MSDKRSYVMVELFVGKSSFGWFIGTEADVLDTITPLDLLHENDRYVLTSVKMTPEDFAALPTFGGF